MATKEKQFTKKIRCGHCQNIAPMEIITSCVEDIRDEDEDPDNGFILSVSNIYEICKCPACNQVTLRNYYWDDGMEPEQIEIMYLYPSPQQIPNGLPDEINKAYDAALKVRKISANAYAVLIGRVLELICEDRSATGKDLYNKLANLAEKGEIPVKLVDVAQHLRALRNLGAHAELGELTDGEVPILDNLIKALVDYVYTAPHLVKMAEKRLDELKSKKPK